MAFPDLTSPGLQDEDPDNPENYHAPDEESPLGAIARGEQVNNGFKITQGLCLFPLIKGYVLIVKEQSILA